MVIGKGNNGGDGLVVARLLREEGREVDVLSTAPLDELQGDAARQPGAAPGRRAERVRARPRWRAPGAIVDALLGTGFSGAAARARGRRDRRDQRARTRVVVACDVPSGVDASSGEVAGEAVRADVTATFHGSKVGLHVAPGAYHAGRGGDGGHRGAPRRARAGSGRA